MILFVKGASQLEKNIRNDHHREGAILIRDHVIDHYMNQNRPDREDLVEYLLENLPTNFPLTERGAVRDANNPELNHRRLSKSDIRRGVKKAYRKLEDGSVKTV